MYAFLEWLDVYKRQENVLLLSDGWVCEGKGTVLGLFN